MRISQNFRQCGLCLGLTLLSAINLTSCPVPIPGGESLKVILATGVADPAKTLPKALVPVPEGDILSLEARVHSVRILPADGDSLLVFAGPVTVDLLSLSSVSALLSSTTAPAGAYEGIEVKVSSATMILATSPDETQELVLADNGNYSLDFAFEILEDSSGLLYIELGGLSVFQQDDSSYLLAPDLSAALRETLPDTRLEGTVASIDSATKSLALTVGSGSFTVDYDGAAIYLPADYDTPSGTPTSLVAGARLAVTGTVGLGESIAPETIEILDLPGTPDDEDGGMVTVCYFYGEDPVVATTIIVPRDRLSDLLAQGAVTGPCDGAEPFTLTYAAGPGGTLSGETTQSVVPGANGTAVTAVPDEGFAFVSWSDGSTLNPRTEVAVGGDVSVTANFAELFTLNYNVGEGGTIVGSTTQHIPLGGDGSPVTVVRNVGYVFNEWSDGRTDNPRSDLNVTADLSVTANFLKLVVLTYTAGTGGTLEGVTVQSFLPGLDGTPVTAVPNGDLVFSSWSDGRTDNPRTDLDVTADVTVTANFVAQFTLNYAADPNGSIEGAATQVVNGGSDGSAVTAVPDATFGFVRWSDGRTDNPRTDEDVDADVSVTATFAPAVSLNYNAGPNGTLTGNTAQIVGTGATGTPVTAVPNEGFGFDSWSDNRTVNPRIDENVTTDINVTAVFLDAFAFVYTAGPNGTITGVATQAVTPGRSGTPVEAVPNSGFVFLRWSDLRTDNPRQDVNANGDIAVTAEFSELFDLHYTAGPNGTLTGNLTQSVRAGATGQPITAVPNEGFGFAGWSDGRFDNPRLDSSVMADVSVTANFSSDITLTYAAGDNGTVSGATTQLVSLGGDGTHVTAIPNEGYFFVEWSDGTSENPRIEENVQAGLNVTARFFRKPEMLAVEAGTFTMGRRDDGDDLASEEAIELPRHEVTLPAYEIGKYEVTNEEYSLFLNYLGHPERGLLLRSDGRQWLGANSTIYYNGGEDPLRAIFIFNYGEVMVGYNRVTKLVEPLVKENMHDGTLYNVFDHPVTESTWYGTAVYCNWLSERCGLEPVYDTTTWEADFSRNGYRMPTEAEWERAAAWDGEKHWTYGFQSDTLVGRDRANYYEGYTFLPPPDQENTLFVNPLGLIQDSQTAYTSPVGWFNGINVSPNQNIQTIDSKSPVGAYDMSGNVFEWCHDWFSPTYYEVSTAVDPMGPESGEDKVVRGGAWARKVGNTRNRTAYRWSFDPEDSDGIVGFRLARSNSRLVQFNLSYAAGPNGTLDGATDQVVSAGASGTPVTAVPNADYAFASWSDGNTDNPRTDIEVESNVSVTANFAIPVTLNYVAGDNGQLEGELEQSFGAGGSGTPVLAVANDGYVFVRWSDGNTDNPRTDNDVQESASFTAEFTQGFDVSYLAGVHGTISGEALQHIVAGGTSTPVTAVADSGFSFVRWSDDSTENPRSDANITSDISVTAEFAEVFTLTYTAGSNGSISGDLIQDVVAGGDGIAVTAVPEDGFVFERWSDERTDNPRTDTEVSADVTVSAFFVARAVLTYTTTEGGTVSGELVQELTPGEDGTAVTAVPDEGFLFLQWSDGQTDNPRTDLDVTTSLSVSATFFEAVSMQSVPAGVFTMGSRDDGDDGAFGRSDEQPRREVTLSAYEIGTFEITNIQFAVFLNFLHHPSRDQLRGTDGSPWAGHNQGIWFYDTLQPRPIFQYSLSEDGITYDSETRSLVMKQLAGLPEGTVVDKGEHPVTEPTWYGAALYTNWLSERSGLEPVYNVDTWEADFTKNGYRLPTEAEWERAAAWDGEKHWTYAITADTLAGRARVNYHDGPYTSPPDYDNVFFVNPLGIVQNAKESYTSPVGWFNGVNVSPNGNVQTIDSHSPVGCYDMSGNVVEWCNDWYSETYYGLGENVDPTGPATGTSKVSRGGAWGRLVDEANQRTAGRFAFGPNFSDGMNGFRIAR